MNNSPENFEVKPEGEFDSAAVESIKAENAEQITNEANRELREFISETQQGLKNIEASGKSAGLSDGEIKSYMEAHRIAQQAEAMANLGRGFFSRMRGRIEMIVAIGMTTVAFSQTAAAETRIKPPVVQDNPQRGGYKDYNSYLQYIDSKRDLKAEEINKEQQELWARKLQDYLKRAAEADEKRKEFLAKGWPDHAKSAGDLSAQWSDLAKFAMQMGAKEITRDPKKNYEAAIALSPEEFQKTSRTMNIAFQRADEQRAWMSGIVHSSDYEKKAKEFENLSDEEIARRKETALSKDVRMADPFHTLRDTQAGAYTTQGAKLSDPYMRPGEYIVDPNLQAAGYPAAVHELEHGITDGNKNMSDYAKNLYAKSYNGPDISTDEGKYYSKATEMDARKKVFEYDLERFEIWKYGEAFTEEHLQKALKLSREDLLSNGSKEFLDYTKPENIPLIMNTIAKYVRPINPQSATQA